MQSSAACLTPTHWKPAASHPSVTTTSVSDTQPKQKCLQWRTTAFPRLEEAARRGGPRWGRWATGKQEAAVPGWRGLACIEGRGQQILRDPRGWWEESQDPEWPWVGTQRAIGSGFTQNLLPHPQGREGHSWPSFPFCHLCYPPPCLTGEKQKKLKLSPSAAGGGF